jgi:hypothetical protein
MYADEIIAEVWRIRDEYAAKHHHNLKEILADLQRRQRRSHRRLVDRRRKPKPGAKAGSAPAGIQTKVGA